jgi:hypothetical protein
MKPVFGEVDTAPLPWCDPLDKMIQTLRAFRSTREILKTNFIEQGRKVKEGAGGMFYDPSAMLAFVRFNFMLRRTLIELMHSDLIFIRASLTHIEAGGGRHLDCTLFGMSAAEPVARIREIADSWKQPFQKEYTERTVNQAFDKLLTLRTCVERGLERYAPDRVEAMTHKPAPAAQAAQPSKSASEPAARHAARGTEHPARALEPAAEPQLDFESCMEQIWEQLIAAPPSRGRSMTTVKSGGARLLMSSWEVAAFVSEDGPAAEDLRRAVVARALVTTSLDTAKISGNTSALERALTIARVEVSRLQERVEVAKQAKDTEAAVNLGISTKRLLSALDEAEKL